MGTLLVTRFLSRIVINAIGGAARSRRREKLYQNLETHDLSEDELERLWPYVAVVVDWSGPMLLLTAGLFLLLGTPMLGLIGLAAIGFGIDAGSTPISIVGGLVLLTALSGPIVSYRLYKRRKRVTKLKTDLKSNPRSVPGTPKYDQLIDVLDLKSGKAYPDTCPVGPDDAVDVEKRDSSSST